MLRQVREADFVLVIASPAYRRRGHGDAHADEGRGVQWEAALIREEYYYNRQVALQKYLPVLLPGRSTDDTPDWLGPNTGTSYRITEFTVGGAEDLIRTLTHQPSEVAVPLGPIPVLPSRPMPRASCCSTNPTVPVTGGMRVSCRRPLSHRRFVLGPGPPPPTSPSHGTGGWMTCRRSSKVCSTGCRRSRIWKNAGCGYRSPSTGGHSHRSTSRGCCSIPPWRPARS